MHRHLSFTLTASLLVVLSTAYLRAADAPSPAEAKLKEQLRSTMLNVRNLETEKAALQAEKTASEAKLKEAKGNIENMAKDIAATKEQSDKSINTLKNTVTERETEIVKLKEALEKWQVSQRQAADLAAKTEAARVKLANDKIVLQRQVADQQKKNEEMFKLGNEILTRYEKFGLGDALTAREPFVGITRIKFQNLIQDFGDKLVDQQIKH